MHTNRLLSGLYYSFFLYACILLAAGCHDTPHQPYHPEYFDSLLTKASRMKRTNGPGAFALLDSGIRAFPNPGVLDLAKAYDIKRIYYVQIKPDNQKALLYADSAILVLRKQLSDPQVADLYSAMIFGQGDIYFSEKDYDHGYKYYAWGSQFVKDTMLKPIYGYNERLGRVMYAQGKFRVAAGYFLSAVTDAKNVLKDTLNQFSIIQEQLDNAGEAYHNAGLLDSAFYFYDSASRYIDVYGARYGISSELTARQLAVVNTNKARLLVAAGKSDTAAAIFKKSAQISAREDQSFAMFTLVQLGTLYLEKNQLIQADSTLQQLEVLLNQFPSDPSALSYLKLKASLLYKQNKPLQAYTLLEDYNSKRDSGENRDKAFIAMDASNKVEDLEQGYRLNALQLKDERSSFNALVAVIITLTVVIILALVAYQLKRHGRYNARLKVLNDEISIKNEDLQAAFTSLEQSHKENTRITRVVAHDLRNPVSAIQNLTYSLLKQSHPDAMTELLVLIKDACTNSLTLIKDLLTAKKKMEETKLELIDMRKLLEYSVELLQAKADEKNQQLTLQTEDIFLKLNRQKIWQVISNIVGNAIRFGYHNAAIDIRLQKIKERNIVLLSVQDDDVVIPSEIREELLNETSGAVYPDASGEGSYGYGLSIARSIIAECNGKLWMESVQEKGSVFYIELPC